MNSKTFTRVCLISLMCLMHILLKAQRFEAESAVLSRGAIKEPCSTCSGSQRVSLKEGNLSFSITVPADDNFNLVIRAAAPAGDKLNMVMIDGSAIDFVTSGTDYKTTIIIAGIHLKAGTHTVQVIKSSGQIDVDYLEVQPAQTTPSSAINTLLVTPQPSDVAQRLYQFLRDQYGSKLISGVMTLNSFDETNWLLANTGKEPALMGLDFMHSGRSYNWYNDKQPIIDAKAWYERHGIPALCWHWRDPLRQTEEFYTAKTTFDVSKIFDAQSPEYRAMISDIDYISGLLKELRDQQVPVIWRPLHEAAGRWFWWGAKGPAACKKLYQLMFDRMVNYHGLNNLIWVWTREPNDDEWYPGDQYVDIVGRDLYRDGDHSSQVLEWTDMHQRYGQRKMVTLSETGSFPDIDNIVRDGAAWSWYMPWYGKYTRESQYNSLTLWRKNFASDKVITLDEMPDLRTYEAVGPVPGPVTSIESNDAFQCELYPSPVTTELQLNCSGGKKKMQIYNARGEMVMDQWTEGKPVVVSVSGWSAGLYYVKCDGRPTLRFIKQ